MPAALFFAAWCFSVATAGAADKPVKLRSGSIHTPDRSRLSPTRVSGRQPTNGLFLIQLESALEPGWRQQLQALGLRLLQYVPDDAFVARLQGTAPSDVLVLPFVRWLGPYEPAQRTDRRLQERRQTPPAAQRPRSDVDVTLVLATDVPTEELEQARALFNVPPHADHHRFGIVLRGALRPGQLEHASTLPSALWIEPAATPRLCDESSAAVVGGPAINHATFAQRLGYDGTGVIVAVADSGLDNGRLTNHTELLGRTKALFSYGGLANAADEHGHGTHVAGIIAGRGITLEGDEYGLYGLGVAPGAQLVIQRVFDARGDYRQTPRETLTHDAVRQGAIIGNSSWTIESEGHYDVAAQQFDELARDADAETPGDQPYLMVFAAGNTGPGNQTIGSPALGKNVIAVGASQGPRTGFLTFDDGIGALALSSGRGPSDDGRIKPDLVAPGTWIASLLSSLGRVENMWEPINNEFAFLGGTSQASPHVAGAAAVFVQFYREHQNGATPSPALIKGALINAAVELDRSAAGSATPNMAEGWGRVDVAGLVDSSHVFEFLDQSVLLTTGQVYERPVFVIRTNCPLVITLAYTDCPGFPGALPALVNDLDLELVAPDGRVYRGNQFANGQSVPGPAARDTINNVEGIRLANPGTGEYRLRVRAQRVALDSRRDTGDVDQDFALVVNGGLPRPSEGIVLVNKPAYRANDVIQIKLIAPNLVSQTAVPVTARSQTEPAGESIRLLPSELSGIFTGAVVTALGPAVTGDRSLQVAHGDWIEIHAATSGEFVIQSGHAFADLRAPVITVLGPTNALGRQSVAWTTDEPASSIVRYGISLTDLGLSVTNKSLTTDHVVEFPGLIPGQLYFFEVISADSAGNVATNEPGGGPGSFTAVLSATVLVVDAYQASPPEPEIPISTYTFPLTEMGIVYDVWNTGELGLQPDLDTLRRYPVVIWRINDSVTRGNDAIPPSQQEAIRQYLQGGGSFFLSSMSVLSRLLRQNAGDFVTNVLHVERFTLNASTFQHCTNCDEDFRVPRALGNPGDGFGQGLDLTLDYGAYPMDGLMGPDFGDTFRAATNAVPFLVEAISGKACGLRYPQSGEASDGRVVFLSVPFDAIPAAGEAPNNRTDVLRRVMRHLAPGAGGVGTLSLNQNAYGLPDVMTVEVADSDLSGQRTAVVNVASDTSPAPTPISLRESTRPGLFRGLIPLAASPAPGTLLASPGDRIRVSYVDASLTTEIETSAEIDATRPDVFDLNIVPGYFDAMVRWTTSEPTDALVQFGESAFLDGTVYEPGLQTNHVLHLVGLAPGRPYFFKITVRDAAGNLTVSDNDDEFHSFETRPALRPAPAYFDDLETAAGSDRWTVLASEDSQSRWSLGWPNDGHTSAPYSGANAWASDLYGDPANIIDTCLVSPAIDLRQANVAQLRFFHSYKFLDLTGFDYVRAGTVLISTNSQRAPVPLARYTEFNFDWAEETIDLMPYAGQVVFLIWRHEMRSAALVPPEQRSGWAIDDVRITAQNVPAGALRVTSNQSRARYSIHRGGLVRDGQGFSQTFTNLPPGDYVVTFGELPFLETPPARTNSVLAFVTNAVHGFYAMEDATANGMPDAWELSLFGAVDPARTRWTDTDHDGMTDLAEYVAGTDPQEANSRLFLNDPLVLNGPVLRFQWPSTIGRSYQLQGWSGVGDWISLSSWTRATSDISSAIIPPPSPGDPFLFRVEVLP